MILFLFCFLVQSCQQTEKGQANQINKVISGDSTKVKDELVDEKTRVDVNFRLDKIVDLFSQSKNEIAASMVVYSGQDTARKWKSVYNYSVKEEKSKVDIMAAKVRMLTEEAEEVKKGKFRVDTESEGTWYLQEMIFSFPGGKEDRKYFGFLKVNGNFCLGDID